MARQPEIFWQSACDRDFFSGHGFAHFDDFFDFAGGRRVVHKRGRSVFRFEIAERSFYLKRNRQHPVEIWKSLSRLRLPKLGARTEWENIRAVAAAGIPTVKPIAFGEHRCCGIESASFTITEELYGAEPLDVVWRRDFAAPRKGIMVREKLGLLQELAELARNFHASGMNHQDFYLNHFFLERDTGKLYLLDLQRMQRHRVTPRRSIVKDLAQLNYSTRVYGGFSSADRLRFLKSYLGCEQWEGQALNLLRRVLVKTEKIARHDVKLAARRRQRGELPST